MKYKRMIFGFLITSISYYKFDCINSFSVESTVPQQSTATLTKKAQWEKTGIEILAEIKESLTKCPEEFKEIEEEFFHNMIDLFISNCCNIHEVEEWDSVEKIIQGLYKRKGIKDTPTQKSRYLQLCRDFVIKGYKYMKHIFGDAAKSFGNNTLNTIEKVEINLKALEENDYHEKFLKNVQKLSARFDNKLEGTLEQQSENNLVNLENNLQVNEGEIKAILEYLYNAIYFVRETSVDENGDLYYGLQEKVADYESSEQDELEEDYQSSAQDD